MLWNLKYHIRTNGDFIAKEYDVAVDIKLYMGDMSKADEVKKGLEHVAKVQKMHEEEIGFGIKVIKATVLLNDKEGGWDAAEEKIKKLNNVSELEVENITRI